MNVVPADLHAVCERMRAERAVALAVHQKPDLDAVGAAAGMIDVFAQLGASATLHLDPAEELPLEDSLLGDGAVRRELPPAGTPLYALDSGSLARVALPVDTWDGFVVNIDHHHDNARFGDLVLLRAQASSTSEVVCDIARCLGVTPAPRAATALYAGISFDSGHFRHASTSPHTFQTAAWLLDCGVDVTSIYEELYERRTLGAVRLWARAVAAAAEVATGRGLIATLTAADYAAAGAGENETEHIVETLRSVDGVEVAALVKEQRGAPRVRVSLRSSGADVSALAARRGGGGHRMAAGFSSDDTPEEVTAWLSTELARLLSTASS